MQEVAAIVIQSCQGGDMQAFAEVVALYERPLFSFVYRLLHGAPVGCEPEDVVQEIFIKAYRKLWHYDPERGNKFSTWLFAIARNQCLDLLRKKTIAARIDDHDKGTVEDLSDPRGETPREALWRAELAQIVAGAVEALPENLKSAFILRHYEEMSHADIAIVMDCNVGTVKSRLARARERLAEMLKDFYGPAQNGGEK